jgi:hypothetical protein
LALADKGALYVTTEANRGDQGNSGLLVRLDLAGSGPPVWSLAGLDYPQFPCVDAAGRVWFVLNRDSWLAAWDLSCALRPLPSPASLPPGSLLAVAGGELVPAGTEPRLRLEVAGHVLEGGPKLAPGSRVLRGWLRLPVEAVPLSRGELYRDRGDPEHPQPGLFAVPPVILQATAGTGTTTALAVRSHVGNRFPMTAIGTANEAAAPGFSEAPVAYLIHFEWRPAAPAGN